jgi:hypothetical protein
MIASMISAADIFAPLRVCLVLALPLLVACAPASAPEAIHEPAREGDAMQTGLASSLHAESFGDSVRFTLRITNTSGRPLELTFPTGQSFDFVVTQDGRQVWRWSDDMMFTQAIRNERLAAEETRTYSETWRPRPGMRGEFTVQGTLTAQQHRVEQRTTFRLP